jgi:hypothetical protein
VYLALDKDALKEALNYSEKLVNMGKEVYLIELDGKDPSDLGFEKISNYFVPITVAFLLFRTEDWVDNSRPSPHPLRG